MNENLRWLLMAFFAILFLFPANWLSKKLLNRRNYSLLIRCIIAVAALALGDVIFYYAGLLYAYDGIIGFHPHELPLTHPVISYIVRGASLGFFLMFAMRIAAGRKQRKD